MKSNWNPLTENKTFLTSRLASHILPSYLPLMVPHSTLRQPIKSQDRLLKQLLFQLTFLSLYFTVGWMLQDKANIRCKEQNGRKTNKKRQSRGWKCRQHSKHGQLSLSKKKKQSKKKRTKKMEHLQVWMWMSVLDTESMSDIKEHLRLHFFLE